MKEVDKIWMDGKLVDWDDAHVHVLSHAIHYGYGVFEGIRCYETGDGKRAIFRLRDHLNRLQDSAHILQISHPWTMEQLVEACEEVIRSNELKDAYIRPTIFVGYGEMGIAAIDNPPVAVVAAYEWGAYLGEEGLKNGVRVCVSSFTRNHVNSHMLKGKINGMYVNNILAKREALDSGFAEAVMLDTDGYVVECTGENLFLINGNEALTPPVTSILAGVTRDAAIRMLGDMGIKITERRIARDELYIADEVFMTGTAAEITPIREIDNRTIGEGKPGQTTCALQDTYMATVRGGRPEYSEWLHLVE